MTMFLCSMIKGTGAGFASSTITISSSSTAKPQTLITNNNKPTSKETPLSFFGSIQSLLSLLSCVASSPPLSHPHHAKINDRTGVCLCVYVCVCVCVYVCVCVCVPNSHIHACCLTINLSFLWFVIVLFSPRPSLAG